MRSESEMWTMIAVTGVTNICMLPAILHLYRNRLAFEATIGAFTMTSSFLYHFAEALDHPLWLTEGQWHRMDNIGSIMCFINLIVYLMDLERLLLSQYLQTFFLAIVLITQEKNPWDELLSFIPIGMALVALIAALLFRKRAFRYNYTMLGRGLAILVFGVGFFIRGLDDDTDPFRAFHGCWHAFVGAAAYYTFHTLPGPSRSSSRRLKSQEINGKKKN